MSPELYSLIKNKEKIDELNQTNPEKSNVFSLGLIWLQLYFLLDENKVKGLN